MYKSQLNKCLILRFKISLVLLCEHGELKFLNQVQIRTILGFSRRVDERFLVHLLTENHSIRANIVYFAEGALLT